MSRMWGPSVFELATGQWRAILMHFGASEKSFAKTGGPCPTCGGTDRFSFKPGNNPNGVSHCRTCGNGEGRTGMQLLQEMTGWEFAEAARQVENVCNGRSSDPLPVIQPEKPEDDESKRRRERKLKNDLWLASRPLVKGDAVDLYFEARNIDQPSYPADLRYCPSTWYERGRYLPAMVAMVRGPDGKPASLHRTFFENGYRVDRKAMPGAIPDGSAIRLSPPNPTMGIAEGIETAFAASERFGMPVWSAINRVILAKWQPPEGVESVAIFPDHDANGHGQKDADRLAERLIADGLHVTIHLPPRVDTDWADYTGENA